MFNITYLELREGQNAALQSGVKRHNEKHHDGTNGPKAYLWYIHTGPTNASQYAWGVGPMKFSYMDEDLSSDHIKDWDKNVSKYARAHSNVFMMRDEDLTYNLENEVVGQNNLIKRFRVKHGPGHMAALEKAVGSISDVLRKTNAKIARRVYKSVFKEEDGYELMLVYPFSSWTRFEDGMQGLPPGFWEIYEKINGEGSHQRESATRFLELDD